jgi:hypothetical protein
VLPERGLSVCEASIGRGSAGLESRQLCLKSGERVACRARLRLSICNHLLLNRYLRR